ncbi:MAG TPA: L,D-transpeptidase family protein, partial [Rhizomicrobium sp.]|nr:L,D-transpeptidase family protein [Rhizomicrobium sp.]
KDLAGLLSSLLLMKPNRAVGWSCCAMIWLMLSGIAGGAAPLVLSESDSRTVQSVLARAADEGLDSTHYSIGASPPAGAVLKAAEGYARDLKSGRRDLRELDSDVALPSVDFDAAGELGNAVRQGTLAGYLASLPPPFPEYERLKSALAKYRGIALAGGWPVLGVGSGDDLLRQRLAYEDTVSADADVKTALRRFQARHGLIADGKLGSATLAALNLPAGARAETIAANMERWRWLPRRLEPDRIMINVADASLVLFLGDQSVLNSRVIVGKPSNPTPILRADGAGITINPSWTVPQSIAAKEILPRLKRNPAWLASQDMVLLNGPPGDPYGLTVNWRAIKRGTFPYQIRQAPGPGNPLGRIKIELPNRFDVYLHDTPGQAAFKGARRDVSHGCVRVEQILPLASYLLTADLGAVEKINALVDSGQTGYLPLGKKLPVYFLYWTSFVGNDGQVQFRPDIYGRDRRLIAAVHSRVQANAAFAGCAKG